MSIHVGPPKISLCTKFDRNPVGGVRVTAPSDQQMPPRSSVSDFAELFTKGSIAILMDRSKV